ncbi:hypothetical protein RE9425_03150 [Prescottella equi]|nr:hypothetical protein RE9425_03150 [Prescottella equi]
MPDQDKSSPRRRTSPSPSALWWKRELTHKGLVFIRPVGRGIDLVDLTFDPQATELGSPLQPEDAMDSGDYIAEITLRPADPDDLWDDDDEDQEKEG